jgi:hybrid polyketide synthase/nonribosomal peptide synthetase ACE1
MTGFGGTNAHAIIEGYQNAAHPSVDSASFTPLTISAASSSALRTMLGDLQGYLLNNPDTCLRDVAHTLQNRRSTFTFRKAITGQTKEDAISKIESLLADNTGDNDINTRYSDVSKPGILGVFTGQGAQWPRMGAWLIEASPFVAKRLEELDAALSSLPEGDRPEWRLVDQLLAEASTSRLSQAAIAQPLCTAVQIILVDLIRAAEIDLRAVVGHSSGEIGAAYAAGFLSATDAIRVAYYRGVYAKLARSPSDETIKGAMMAAGTSYEDALEFCEMDDFEGRIQVAARNSSTSVTLSGDEDAINEAEVIFKDEGKFARKLKVDTAYHSHHMQACAGPYREALERCNITVQSGNSTKWFSSVVDGQIMTKELVESQYWVDNMTGAVLFAPAVANAVAEAGPFDLGVEFGPHPALKGPCLDTVEELVGHKIPYTGLLARQKNDLDELSAAIGFVWAQLGAGSVNFGGFEKLISGVHTARHLVADLPQYPFDRSRSFYTLTRLSGSHQNAHAPLHPLLGRRCVETEADDEVSWRNVLRSTENSWLQGHALQGQAVFPAMGYLAMAVEAAAALAGPDRKLGLISLDNVSIGRAMAFSDESVGMEARVSMKITRFTEEELSGRVTCHSGLPYDSATPLALNFTTNISVVFHEPEANSLPVVRADEINLANAEPTRLYSQFNKLGYNYSAPFTGVKHIQRKKGFATGDIEDISGDKWEDQLLIHPALLDSALQTAFAAYCHPHDERFWTLHVPTGIRSVVINPYFTDRGAGRHRSFQYQSACRDDLEAPVVADIDVFAGDGSSNAFVQFESVQVQPFAASGPRDDACLFTHFEYKLAEPDARLAVVDDNINVAEAEAIFQNIERVGFYILRSVYENVKPSELESALPHFRRLLDFTSRTVPRVARGNHPTVPKEALDDSPAYIRSLIAKHHNRADMQLLGVINEHLVTEMRQNGSMIEHMLKDGLLDRFYEEGFDTANVWIARIIKQITHRHPRMRLFEVGAGTGGSTRFILPQLGDAFSSYTFTDLSAGFFERANDRFITYSDRMVYSAYNMENSPSDQGYEEGTYDVVLASNALHATGKIEETIANARRLLRPGGYMVLLEIMGNDFLGIGASMGGLPGWWAGAEVDPTRCDGPCFTVSQWDALVKRHGFSGVETHTPLDRKMQWYAVLVCRAVDDKVASLQEPLSADAPIPQSNNLVIVGGRTPTVAKLVNETTVTLQSRYSTITHIETLEELTEKPQAPGSSILSLTELDQQFLETRTEAKLDALKVLWRNSRTVLWVTRGARNESPYSSSMIGLSRVVRFEYPHLNLQVVDFDKLPESQVVAESLVRLELAKNWEEEGVNMLATVEPELHYVDEKLFIPRLYQHTNANDRFNTYRRTVPSEVNPQETLVLLEPTADGKSVKPCAVSPLRLPREADSRSRKQVTIQVHRSLIQSVKIGETGFFTLLAGTEMDSGEYLLGLADSAIESSMQIPVERTMKATATSCTSGVLGNVVATMLAKTMLSDSPSSGTVVVHEASDLIRDALDKEAAKEGVQTVFTSSTKRAKQDDTTVFVHDRLPTRLIQKILPRDISRFIDLSANGMELIHNCLPKNTPTATLADYIRLEPSASSTAALEDAGQALKLSWNDVTKQRRSKKVPDAPAVIPINETGGFNAVDGQFSIVDWNTESVKVSLRPIDTGRIFRDDGTYFLLGLSGELGQSLCSWMVAHGARHVVLSSRSPKVDPRYVEEIAAQGADVRVMAADITWRESVRACYDTICREMPPIIGVANGAMILEDVMFDDLEFASQERTMPPKVEGSLYLDEIFYDTPLDFFVLFTSLAHIGGNTGQSTYVMANLFMNALAAQRRDIRGVAGSDMAIGSVTGMGFFERSSLDKDHFSRLGYRNMSEQDLHQQFAEAILAGRPGSNVISEVVAGLQPYHNTPNIQAQLRMDPRFRHFLLEDREAGSAGQSGGTGKMVKPRTRLATVKTRAEAVAVVQETFIDRLKRILLMSSTDIIDPMSSLVELGADSIMAVDVRAWFLKELDVDVPVLKILGPGETVAVLVEEAVDKLPVEIIDISKLAEGGNELPAQAVPQKPEVSLQAIQQAAREYNSSSGTDTASSPVSGTPLDTLDATPLETPMGTEADIFDQKSQLQMKLQKHQENTGQSWRQKIVESSTEHTEQMTFGQNRFWFLTHYVDDPTTFNIAYLGKLSGRIRVDDLSKAVESAALRHETLRTRFFWSEDDTKTPMQGILSKPLVRLETATIVSRDDATRELDAMRDYVWDLGDWVPIRMRLLSLSETEHFLIIGSHHISMDGHSFSVLMLDIQQAYNNPGNRLTPLADGSQARAFGAQQRLAQEGGNFKAAINYHRNMLPAADFTHPIELFSFARTQVRPPLDSYGTHVAKIHLPADITTKMKQLAKGHRATAFHAYLAALQALLFRLLPASTTDKVFIGLADANRLDSKFMGSIGNFLNVLPLRFDRADKQSFGKAMEVARDRAYGVLTHSAMPFDLLLDELDVPRSNSWAPIFQIFMDYRLVVKDHANKDWIGCKIGEENWHTSKSGYDVALEIMEGNDGAMVAIHVQQALYDASAAELLVNSYANVLKQVVAKGDRLAVQTLSKWDIAVVKKDLGIGLGKLLYSLYQAQFY